MAQLPDKMVASPHFSSFSYFSEKIPKRSGLVFTVVFTVTVQSQAHLHRFGEARAKLYADPSPNPPLPRLLTKDVGVQRTALTRNTAFHKRNPVISVKNVPTLLPSSLVSPKTWVMS